MEIFDGKSCVEWAKAKLWRREENEKDVKILNEQFDERNVVHGVTQDLDLIFAKLKGVMNYLRSSEGTEDPKIIHKIHKCHRRLGKLINKSSLSTNTTQSDLNVEMKLLDIERKVDQILQTSAHSMSVNSKKSLKRQEKKLFDVDINLNISTDGHPSVKAVSATSSTVKKHENALN